MTEEEKLEIGRQIYHREISRAEAMQKYSICHNTVENYLMKYKKFAGIPPKKHSTEKEDTVTVLKDEELDIDSYRKMSKDELIDELIRAKADVLRAKKGYEVKGSGAEKEFSPLKGRNLK